MVKEINSVGEYEQEISGPGLVVVDFFTTWCGPCKAVAPFIEQLVVKYPEVKFIKVDIEKNEDIAAPLGISSIPTFYFFVRGQKVDEMKGADPRGLEDKVARYKVDVDPFKGSGNKLSAGNDDAPAMSAREARLKAFAAMEGPKKVVATPAPAPAPAAAAGASGESGLGLTDGDVDEDEALAKAMKLSMAEGSSDVKPAETKKSGDGEATAEELAAAEAELDAEEAAKPLQHYQEAPGQEWEEEMVPVPVNEELLSQMLEMGFVDVRARKALVHGGSLEGAMAWIDQHQDDPDIDQPYMVKKSDTIPKPPLTEEEKREKAAAIQERIKQRRQERAQQEKAEAIKREKERRERGQKMEEVMEERQRMQRKREQEKIKREKMEEKKERERLRAEIARDKEIRRKNKGVLPSVLGVDGYNPSIVQYDQPASGGDPAPADSADAVPAKRMSSEPATASATAPPKQKKPTAQRATSSADDMDPKERVEQFIKTIMRYRTGGDGGQALKLLLTFVKNVVDNPSEPKFRSINTESNAFKTKLKPLVGTVALLKTVGFEMDESDDKLKYQGDLPNPLLTFAKDKLSEAYTAYTQMNP